MIHRNFPIYKGMAISVFLNAPDREGVVIHLPRVVVDTVELVIREEEDYFLFITNVVIRTDKER